MEMDDGSVSTAFADRAVKDALTVDPVVVAFVSRIILEAVKWNATGISFERRRREVYVEIWVDGIRRELARLNKDYQAQMIVDWWKSIAGLDIGERRKHQAAVVNFKCKGKAYRLLVNALPHLYGEKVYVHFLCNSDTLFGLDKMNLSVESAAALRRLSQRKSGLILTGGHGGSGKTTLLYSLLLEAKTNGNDGLSLMTIEDPVEYPLEGVSQTEYRRSSGVPFDSVLKSFSRSDADVVLCGRLYDNDSIDACLDLAYSGRRVLSAIKTGDAISVIVNLRSRGIEDYRIAGGLSGLIGQSLVRRIDSTLTEQYEPADDDLRKAGLTRDDGPFFRGVATEENGGTGYKGRIPLVEVVEMTPEFRRLTSAGAPFEQLWQAAFSEGGSLRDDGRARVRAGLTTIEEVNRVLPSFSH